MEKIKRQITWIALLFPILFYAQGIQIGLKGGANFSNFTGGNIENIDFKHATNFHAGLAVEFNLTPSFSIQPEIMYITQGANLDGFGDQIKNRLGYVAVPVLAKFYLIPGKLSIEAGPQVSVLVNEADGISTSDTEKIDFSLAAGAGFNVTNHIFVQARYVAGISKVNSIPSASGNVDIKNSAILLSLGYWF
ncbi:MAG: porin family protein [Flavobacterium sp.]